MLLLVHLDVLVDVSDKLQWCVERHSAHHEEEDKTGQDGVAKIFHCLKEAVHMGTLVVVEQWIGKHKQTSGSVVGETDVTCLDMLS